MGARYLLGLLTTGGCVPFCLVLLNFHDHLKIFELLVLPEVVYSFNEWLFSHSYDLFTDVLDDVVLKCLKSIITILSILYIAILNYAWSFSSESAKKLLILFVDPVLLRLDGFNDFVLGLGVVWASIAVTRNVCSVIVLSPFHLRHVDPGLGLRLDFNGWS